jgi:hypothetical protein
MPYFLGSIDRASLYNLVNKTKLSAQFILSIFINLYMFRATVGLTSGETAVFVRHLVLVLLSGMQCGIPPCIPDSYSHRIISAKCRTNTVVSPDDRPIVARNM